MAHRRGRSTPGRLLAVTRLVRRPSVPEDAAEHAVLDQLDALLRRALEVECLRQAARIERIVREREALVEDLLAHLAGREAPLLDQPPGSERVVGKVEEQLREGVRLEHRGIRARLELMRTAGALGGLDRAISETRHEVCSA